MSRPSVAKQALEDWGATVELLPTSTKKESDWLAVLDGCRLLIEEKTKLPDPASEAERQAAFRSGQVYERTIPLTHNNVLSGIVRNGARQLASTGSELAHDLRVFWVTSDGPDAKAKHLQFIATLYGSTNTHARDQHGSKPCYFFRNSDFFRFDCIDGAVVAYSSGDWVTMNLCLNPYSQGWQALRDSPYAKYLATGLIDPLAEEATGEAYVADTDADRRDQGAVLSYLQAKYGTGPLMNMDMNMASVEVVVPRSRA
jgi:hypothetical protein